MGRVTRLLQARENNDAYKKDASVLRETITSTLTALAEGKIKPDEMSVPEDTNERFIRYAPGFGTRADTGARRYTVEALAKFLGEVRSDRGEVRPRHEFVNAFNSLELMSENHLSEATLLALNDEPWKIGEVVRICRLPPFRSPPLLQGCSSLWF